VSYPTYPNQPPGVPYGPPPDHPRATLALILGIVAIVLCPVVAPFSWVIGRRAVKEIDASGGALGGRAQAMAGYIIGMVVTILLALIVVGGAIILAIASAASSA